MSATTERKSKINFDLEALRGFAALIVVFSHISYYHTDFDPFYYPDFVGAFKFNGHFCVFIFFMLSGYVIGISNKVPLTSRMILPYLKKRFVRIYPIYVISIMVAILVAARSYSMQTIAGNFTFMQPVFVKIIHENNPIWSLNYEVLYYLLFIPISFFNINPVVVLISSFVVGMGNFLLYPRFQMPIISSYAFGFTFWIIGLCIARYFKQEKGMSYRLMVSNVFLILAMGYNHVLNTIFYVVTVDIFKLPAKFPDTVYWADTVVNYNDLAFLPYCFIFILNFTSKDYKWRRIIGIILQLLPLFFFPYLINRSIHDRNLLEPVFSVLFYLISLLLFFIPFPVLEAFGKWVINYGIRLGGISYGLYIIHFPLLVLLGRFQYFAHTGFEYAIRLIVYFTLTVGVSYLLERKYQAAARNFFYK